jgi:predicted dehydrogenase
MANIKNLSVIGVDQRTRVIASRLSAYSPFHAGPIKLATFSTGPADPFADMAGDLARLAGVPLVDWRSAAGSASSDAVYVGGPYPGRAQVVIAALEAGKPVLCPLPIAISRSELDKIESVLHDGVLYTPTDLRSSIAGKQALAVATSGRLGALHSIYGAIRARRNTSAEIDVLDDLGWELLDYVHAIAGANIERVYAAGGRLFAGSPDDSVMMNIRFTGDILVTLEMARSLPQAAPKGYEADIEVAGANSAIRVEPYKYDVDIVSEDLTPQVQDHSWHLHPVIEMLEDFETLLVDKKPSRGVIAANRALLRTMTMARKSLDTKDAVTE